MLLINIVVACSLGFKQKPVMKILSHSLTSSTTDALLDMEMPRLRGQSSPFRLGIISPPLRSDSSGESASTARKEETNAVDTKAQVESDNKLEGRIPQIRQRVKIPRMAPRIVTDDWNDYHGGD